MINCNLNHFLKNLVFEKKAKGTNEDEEWGPLRGREEAVPRHRLQVRQRYLLLEL